MAQRRFLVPASLARLIRREVGATDRIVEGYFPTRPDLDHFVSIEPGHSYLVLRAATDGNLEERTEVPRSQAEALLTVCAGKIGFECTSVRLRGGKQALLQRLVAPEPLDLLRVEFSEGEDADGFDPPVWFGPEVTGNPAYDRGSMARAGVPASPELLLSNAMLDELLDVLEEGMIAAQPGRVPSPNDRSPDGHSGDASPTEIRAPSIASARQNLMSGLAEALRDVEQPRSAPDLEATSAGETAPIEPARPRFRMAGWRTNA